MSDDIVQAITIYMNGIICNGYQIDIQQIHVHSSHSIVMILHQWIQSDIVNGL